MSRLALLFWQLMVAVVALSLWQFLATVEVFGKILLPQFAMMMIYLIMALVLIFRPNGLMPARRFSVSV